MPARVSPLYRRLPPGPHRLTRSEVARHQRLRIHGAMIEAVAEHGYAATSVGLVVGLAGVSRRCFYEQFANKEQCFLATFDLIAGRGLDRVRRAYIAAGGDRDARLAAAFGQFAELAVTRRKAASLVLLEAQTAGTGGLLHVRRLSAACEGLLARSFIEPAGARPLPAPLLRAIAGGLREAMSGFVREPASAGGADRADPAESLVEWTLSFQSPAAERMSDQLAERVVRRLRASATGARGSAYMRARRGDSRSRVLESALRLAALDDYGQLTAARIADAANLSMDAFHELFAGRDECFLAALDMLGAELLSIAAAAGPRSSGWAQAARRAIGELMCFLAEHPVYARTIAREAFGAGPRAARRNLDLSHSVAALLTRGAPEGGPKTMLVDGLAGAIWHTVLCQVAAARIQLLPAMSDYLTYVALAPSIGAEAAAEVIREEIPS